MGRVMLRIVSGDIHVGNLTADEYDTLYDTDNLEDELDAGISNALTDLGYELYYEED